MPETALSLIVFLFPLAYSPGPGNMVFAAIGARFGLHATVPALTGYHAATWLVTMAIGLGFAAVIERFPAALDILRPIGAAFVLWLAWQFFRAGATDTDIEARPAGFLAGSVLLLLNPKAYLIIVLMFTQFLPVEETSQMVSILFISTIFTVNNLIAFTAWAAVGDRLAGRFRDEEQSRWMNRVFGAVLAAVAVWMLLA